VKRIFSFDVYDTLLTRTVALPTDLFINVGEQLHGASSGTFTALQYRDARIRAEAQARTAVKPKDDCTLADIFDHFDALKDWGVTPAQAIAAELATERSLTRPIAVMANTVRRALADDEHVIFLSDMYLPGDFIWELLCLHIAPVERDRVFVSGDLGLGKYTGRLYEYVMRHYDLPASSFIHVGDNQHADVKVARRLGMTAQQCESALPNRYEAVQKSADYPDRTIGAKGIARASRVTLSDGDERHDSIARLASDVVGPILLAFVAWVLDDARKRGVERLYFAARDGQIFFKIATRLRRDGDPECRYLYGSRQAWLLPAVIDVTESSLEWAWTRTKSRRGDDILRRLEIDTDKVRQELEKLGLGRETLAHPLSDHHLSILSGALTSEPLRSVLAEVTAERRELALGYFREQGLLDGKTWALVDIGWILQCQRALKSMLDQAGISTPIHGYYFGIAPAHVPLVSAGGASPFVSHPDSGLTSPLNGRWFFKLTTILLQEHVFTVADHPSTHRYVRDGETISPAFNKDSRDAEVLDFASALHTAILHYCDEICLSPEIETHRTAFREYAFGAMHDFCMAPTAEDVRGIAWLPTNAEQSHDQRYQRRLASRLSLADVWSLVRHDLSTAKGDYFAAHFAWLAGSAALSERPVRAALSVLQAGNDLRVRLRSSRSAKQAR